MLINNSNLINNSLFDDYLKINKKFKFSVLSKNNNSIDYNFPIYFNTNEFEINPHRKSLFNKNKSIKFQQQKFLKFKKIDQSSSINSKKKSEISLADSLKLSQSNRPSSSSSSSSSTTTTKINPKSIQSNIQPSSIISNQISNTKSNDFNNNSNNPLGITLLKIMFDSNFINKIYNPSKNNSIYPHGLQNSGNLCYMNSILQFLFYCDPFNQLLNIIRDNSYNELNNNNNKTPILNALLDLQNNFKLKPSLLDSNSSIINPNNFYNSISSLSKFSHLSWGRQEDAEELLNILLDGLHEEFIDSIKSLSNSEILNFANNFNNIELTKKIIKIVNFIKDLNNDININSWNEINSNLKSIGKITNQIKLSPIVNLFGGQFKSILKSSNKKYSITLDPFLQIQLDISDPDTIDLITAFEKFSKDEEVQLNNTFAKKQNLIDKLPSILLIHLKRFSFVTNNNNDFEDNGYEIVSNNKKGKKNLKFQQQQSKSINLKNKLFDGHIEKIHKFIKYDHILKLPKSCISNLISEEPNFKLLGVVYHHGRSTENGHYTTDVLTNDGNWIRIDDTNITKISPNDVISDQNLGSNINKTAYILMFQKI